MIADSADTGRRPRVSVIVPTHNGSATVGACIESVLRTRYPSDRLELIVVDNMSTDDTRDVLARYPIVALRQDERRGAYAARNTGVAHATGAAYYVIENNDGIATGIRQALDTAATGQPVVVDVRIDYSKRTRFTQGVVKTVLKRFPLGDKFRFIGRALFTLPKICWKMKTKVCPNCNRS